MSYFHYLCVFVYSDVQHKLCFLFIFVFVTSSCLPYADSFSGLSFFVPAIFPCDYLRMSVPGCTNVILCSMI